MLEDKRATNTVTMLQSEAPSQDSDNISPIALFLSVLKRPWILIISVLVIMVPLVGYVISIVDQFTSQAVVMVTVRGRTFQEEVAALGEYSYDERSEKYYTSILESQAFRDAVVEQIMISRPGLDPDSVRKLVRSDVAHTTNPREQGFLKITATSTEPEFALLMAQAALGQFRSRCIQLDRQEIENVASFINNQIKDITDNLRNAEKALQDFLSSRRLVITDLQAGVVGELFRLEQNLSKAQANLEMQQININSYRDQLNKLMNNLSSIENKDRFGVADELKMELDAKRAELYGMGFDTLTIAERKQLKVEIDKLRQDMLSQMVHSNISFENEDPSSLGITIQTLEGQLESSLILQTSLRNEIAYYTEQIARFKVENPDLSYDILQYAQLTRSKDVLRRTLEFMLDKKESARIRIEMEQGGIRVLDEPRLSKIPISSGKPVKVAAGLIAAVLLGVLISWVVDRLDRSVKDETEVRAALGLPVFGTIPVLNEKENGIKGRIQRQKLPNGASRNGEKLLSSFPQKSPIAESYRSMKISLAFEARDKGKKVFVISSPAASEGKSLTSANLAISFAQGNKKTLLIDGDLRRSVQHKLFKIDRTPGLTDYLFEKARMDSIIRESGVDNLHIITAGELPSNPAELLASNQMQKFIEQIRPHYDIILIDTAPIMVCSDPLVVSEYSDGVLLIARVEFTNIKALEHCVYLIKRLNIETLGIILNQVEHRFGLPYYYTYRYYKPYSYYGGYSYQREYYQDSSDSEKGA